MHGNHFFSMPGIRFGLAIVREFTRRTCGGILCSPGDSSMSYMSERDDLLVQIWQMFVTDAHRPVAVFSLLSSDQV